LNKTGSENKLALITGGSRGLGAAIAVRLAAEGYDIWLNFRQRKEAAEKVKSQIEDRGRKCTLLPFDVSNAESVKVNLEPMLESSTPDVLVNNAGFNKDTLMMWMSLEEWTSVTDVTLLGFFLVTKAVLLGMMKRRSGRIINIASTAGQFGLQGMVNYSAAKAGLIGATKSLAREVVKRGILVNAVAPGFIETEMTDNLPVEEIRKTIPMGKFGKAEDVAGAVAFLCSEDSNYIAGQVISVNGGIYM
jgi:3-oxoacyl-[acyl-carrier protein] reductase